MKPGQVALIEGKQLAVDAKVVKAETVKVVSEDE